MLAADEDCGCLLICPLHSLLAMQKLGGSPSLIAGTTVIPGISIGENALIGAGACVVCDIPDGARAWGVPAKIKNRRC
jgi:serine acetyltransferase